MTKTTATDSRTAAVVHLIAGLTADGADCKQWYLEQAFRSLCTDRYVDDARREFGWEDGRKP